MRKLFLSSTLILLACAPVVAQQSSRQGKAESLGVATVAQSHKNVALERMRKQAELVRKAHLSFTKELKGGKLDPWKDLRNKYTDFEKLLDSLELDKQAVFVERDPRKRRELILALQAALLPVGPYLRPASFRPVDQALTANQKKELDALVSNVALPDDQSNKTIEPLTPTFVYTLSSIAVPIELRVPPGAEVYLHSGGGGEFQNGLPMQKLVADDKGLAKTSWLTRGDASGDVMIEITSPQTSNRLNYEIEVLCLALKQLPDPAQLKEKLLPRIKSGKTPRLPEPVSPVTPSGPVPSRP